jgi:acyl-CoA synthetase (AMP-forming)/AMP-acid ligase II
VDLARNLIGRINVGDTLTRAAAARPRQLAVVDGSHRFTYADFNAYVNRLAHGLAGLGYERGSALALASGNSADFLAVYYACAKLGAVCGYLYDDDATDKAAAYGWFHSGDVGRFGQDGVLWFTDRYKDVIKTGGENVASIEVEKAVYAADPRVAEVVVVGLPHERWSEAVTAVVVPKPGERIDATELIAAVKTRLDGYKVPKSVIFTDQLPRTSTGKIRKNVVRSEHAAHDAPTGREG